MYQQLTDYYLIRSFVVSLFAVHLMVLYFFVCDGYFTTYYGGILVFHTPVWLILLLTAEMLLRKVKVKLPVMTGVFGFLLAAQLYIAPEKMNPFYDFQAFYYATVFLFCTSIFACWQKFRKLKFEQQ